MASVWAIMYEVDEYNVPEEAIWLYERQEDAEADAKEMGEDHRVREMVVIPAGQRLQQWVTYTRSVHMRNADVEFDRTNEDVEFGLGDQQAKDTTIERISLSTLARNHGECGVAHDGPCPGDHVYILVGRGDSLPELNDAMEERIRSG